MMLTEDIANALYRDCSVFGIPVYRRGNIPSGEITEPRVVILPKGQTPQAYWRKCYVEVNICVPDLPGGNANLLELGKYERLAGDYLSDEVGRYDDEYYRYSIASIGIEADESMKCHYVNVRLLFEVLNC